MSSHYTLTHSGSTRFSSLQLRSRQTRSTCNFSASDKKYSLAKIYISSAKHNRRDERKQRLTSFTKVTNKRDPSNVSRETPLGTVTQLNIRSLITTAYDKLLLYEEKHLNKSPFMPMSAHFLRPMECLIRSKASL